ncbi:uncharacterized protein LOC112494868 isoform X2 [Cephus cinctus]|uniref:Uncharacterized protein LOC112494868 isoform X2 n=1 Tax=Cephus cinctus TaxID=211228 RepID=A0AAJ7RP53_CEPCN|nr:uncharacterized protein LOC112494868 isoform X2 [Cephus cinctus]XP_024944145.1 uncharacterized protein LOC112494868 isoform X2 [Cephus cinctus]
MHNQLTDQPRREVFENWVEYLDISNRQLMNLHAFGNGNRAGSKHLRLLVNRFCNAELNGGLRLVEGCCDGAVLQDL